MTNKDNNDSPNLRISTYPHPFKEHAAEWARNPDIPSLLKFKMLPQIVPLELEGVTHQVHVTLFVGHTAIALMGIDGQLWEVAVLCFDGEALSFELLEWRKTVAPKWDTDETLEEKLDQVFEDPFYAALSDLAYKLEALSLIESLPEVE